MGIIIKEPTEEGYAHNLSVRGLVPGDYFVASINGFLKDESGNFKIFTHPQYGNSYLSYLDVYEYEYADTEKREFVSKKLPEPVRCSFFMSETLKNKIDKSGIPIGQLMKVGMKKLDGGRSTYTVESFIQNSTTKHEVGIDIDALQKSITALRTSGFNSEQIVSMLKDKFPENKIKELL